MKAAATASNEVNAPGDCSGSFGPKESNSSGPTVTATDVMKAAAPALKKVITPNLMKAEAPAPKKVAAPAIKKVTAPKLMKAASQAVKKVTALAPTKKNSTLPNENSSSDSKESDFSAQRKELPRAINELLWLPRTKQHLD